MVTKNHHPRDVTTQLKTKTEHFKSVWYNYQILDKILSFFEVQGGLTNSVLRKIIQSDTKISRTTKLDKLTHYWDYYEGMRKNAFLLYYKLNVKYRKGLFDHFQTPSKYKTLPVTFEEFDTEIMPKLCTFEYKMLTLPRVTLQNIFKDIFDEDIIDLIDVGTNVSDINMPIYFYKRYIALGRRAYRTIRKEKSIWPQLITYIQNLSITHKIKGALTSTPTKKAHSKSITISSTLDNGVLDNGVLDNEAPRSSVLDRLSPRLNVLGTSL